jgi:DNA (cytosine-5)-methyltransferase 1
MNKIRVISLFAGIGGICLAFKNAGASLVWANEFDKAACITYRANFGDSYLHEGDIRDVDPIMIPEFDILTAGFPCQAFSVAGYRKGFDDERGNLFFEILRIIDEKNPKAILLENVKNLKTHDHGRTFSIIMNELSIRGFSCKVAVLNTMDYGDVPQNRERVYIVGFKDVFSHDKFSFPERKLLTSTIADVLSNEESIDESFYYTNTKYYPFLRENMTNKSTVYQWRRVYLRENKSNVCPTLTANMGTGGHNVPLVLDNKGIRKLTPEECLRFQGFPDNFMFPPSVSRASRYKQAGNSVSVPVVQLIAKSMINAMEGT